MIDSVYQELFNQALAAHKAGDFNKALDLYNRLLNRGWNSEALRFFMADVFLRMEWNGLAINLLDALLEKNPGNGKAWCNLGVAFRKENFLDEARNAWERAISIDGVTPEVCSNMAGLYADRCQPRRALEWCRRTLELDPNDHSAQWHESLALLTMRRWDEGWKKYESRRKLDNWDGRKRIDAPDWDGQKLGEHEYLYLHGEQGVGDELMFLRVMDHIVKDAQNIIVEVNPRVADIVRSAWPSVVVVTSETEGVEYAETHGIQYAHKLPLGSAYGMLHEKLIVPEGDGVTNGNGILIEASIGIDPAKQIEYRRRLVELGPRPWIALAWMGGGKTTNVIGRSCPIKEFKPIMDRFTCISAQYEHVVAGVDLDRESIGLKSIDRWSAGANLADQAALISVCDAVITVPQTLMHVAGITGTPCYVMLPEYPDWRFGIEGDELPFHSSVRLIRKDGKWSDQIQRAIEMVEENVDYA